MSLELRIVGDPILREVAKPVEVFDRDLKEFAESMIRTMREENGIGLAAPQVGVAKRLIVAVQMQDFDDHEAPEIALVNPEIVRVSQETWSYDEGCLSVPGISAMVIRPKEVEVNYQDLDGASRSITGTQMFGRILLHEIDHLNGKLFIDYLSTAQRSLIKSKLKNITHYKL
jgi:peptide deformylase